ncbi:MAG: hypothetical protein OXG54_12590, partial [Gammaproteobacteria bacterium]|nr:hypothetical protein [Gammaproteobacteria bacterium]
SASSAWMMLPGFARYMTPSDEVLFASPLEETSEGMITYREEIRADLVSFCRDALLKYVPEDRFFPCEPL